MDLLLKSPNQKPKTLLNVYLRLIGERYLGLNRFIWDVDLLEQFVLEHPGWADVIMAYYLGEKYHPGYNIFEAKMKLLDA